MCRSLALATFAALLGLPAVAAGHANLMEPNPRNMEANKTGPCGVARTLNPTLLTAGQTLTVRWAETIEHPGYYRIAFSPAADTGFDENVLVDNIPDTQGGTMPHLYETDVVLPDLPCTDCTLQLIQYMTETTPPSLYYSCADIVLAAPAPADAGPTPPDAAPGSADATSASDGALANDNIGDPPGLCSAAAGSSSAVSGLFILASATLLLRNGGRTGGASARRRRAVAKRLPLL